MTRLYADLYFYKTMVMGDQKSIGFLFVCLFCCVFFFVFSCPYLAKCSLDLEGE